jgi:hypothetical protein
LFSEVCSDSFEVDDTATVGSGANLLKDIDVIGSGATRSLHAHSFDSSSFIHLPPNLPVCDPLNQSLNITSDQYQYPVLLEDLLLSIENLPISSLRALAKSHGIITKTKETLDKLRNMLSEHIFKGSCSSLINDGCTEVLKGLRTQADSEMNCDLIVKLARSVMVLIC